MPMKYPHIVQRPADVVTHPAACPGVDEAYTDQAPPVVAGESSGEEAGEQQCQSGVECVVCAACGARFEHWGDLNDTTHRIV